MSTTPKLAKLSQEAIVLCMTAVLFVFFSIFSESFLDIGNLLTLLRNVAILGFLALAMSIVVIGRGIDLGMVSIMVIASAYFLTIYNSSGSPYIALFLGLVLAVAAGLLQGWLVAYAEVPAIFATLAMGVVIYGFGQYFLIPEDVSYLPASDYVFLTFGRLRLLGVPIQIYLFMAAAIAAHFFLNHTKYGRFTYALGDNLEAARLVGISVRKLTVFHYLLAAIMAYIAGLVTVSSVSSMSLRIVNSTLIYDVILVVVIGGIGLSGGKGGVRNVIVGTMLIGILLNGMTLMNVPFTAQNIVKGTILLFALMADSFLNPRNEQTEKQGDI